METHIVILVATLASIHFVECGTANVIHNATKEIIFLKKPPPFKVNDVGERITFECIPDLTNETTDIQVQWILPFQIEENRIESSTGIYVNESKLVISFTKKEFSGFYECVLFDGERKAVAPVWLHVLRMHRLNIHQRIVVAVIACACAAVLMGAILCGYKFLSKRNGNRRVPTDLGYPDAAIPLRPSM